MDDKKAQVILDQIVGQIFGYKNPYSLEDFRQKFLFDVRLPQQVDDSVTGEKTWAQSVNPTKFITFANSQTDKVPIKDFIPEMRPIKTVEDILGVWNEINYVATERYIDSRNVYGSDNVYGSENVYRSVDVRDSNKVIFTDGVKKGESVAGIQRSNNISFSARVDDSMNIGNSFAVSWSAKITNSLFIDACSDMFECMFCSHISGKKFCIANLQFEEAEYHKLKKMIVAWILNT